MSKAKLFHERDAHTSTVENRSSNSGSEFEPVTFVVSAIIGLCIFLLNIWIGG